MPEVGLKHFLREQIIEALKTAPSVTHLNTVDGEGVYASERLETDDSIPMHLAPVVVVDMPVQTDTESVGPATTIATLTTTCYLYFGEMDDKLADEFASLYVTDARRSLFALSYTPETRLLGGYSNNYQLEDIGWGEYGQDKVYSFEINFRSARAASAVITVP